MYEIKDQRIVNHHERLGEIEIAMVSDDIACEILVALANKSLRLQAEKLISKDVPIDAITYKQAVAEINYNRTGKSNDSKASDGTPGPVPPVHSKSCRGQRFITGRCICGSGQYIKLTGVEVECQLKDELLAIFKLLNCVGSADVSECDNDTVTVRRMKSLIYLMRQTDKENEALKALRDELFGRQAQTALLTREATVRECSEIVTQCLNDNICEHRLFKHYGLKAH